MDQQSRARFGEKAGCVGIFVRNEIFATPLSCAIADRAGSYIESVRI